MKHTTLIQDTEYARAEARDINEKLKTNKINLKLAYTRNRAISNLLRAIMEEIILNKLRHINKSIK